MRLVGPHSNRDVHGRCKKDKYPTRAKARKRLKLWNRADGPRSVYYCHECEAWHLTSERRPE